MKLSVKALALTGGIMWGACLFLWTLIVALTPIEMGRSWLQLMVGTYPYYAITPIGALVGLIVGFVDGFCAFAIFGLLYNLFVGKKV